MNDLWNDMWLRVKARFTPERLLMRASVTILMFAMAVVLYVIFRRYW